MSRFRRNAVAILALEFVIIIVMNILCYRQWNEETNRIYRVEIARLVEEMEEKSPDKIDLTKYGTILGIDEFHPEERCNDDYVVEKVGNQLYRIRYHSVKRYGIFAYLNGFAGILILITAGVFAYVEGKIIRPFYRMSEMTYDLAKGNLVKPIKEEKNRYFGRFIWGIDMLRENLEANKEKEMKLQKEKKGLLLSLSHDIRTPLSAIELYNKALIKGMYQTEDKKKEAYLCVERNIEEIKTYVDEIVKASREDFLNLSVRAEEFYLSEAINNIEAYYREKLSILHIGFDICSYEDCILKGDKDRFIEVMQNILENAIKYGDGKKISISVLEEEDCRLVVVDNTGNNLIEEELPNIFDSFYRGSNSKNIKGSGLGLYICRCLMRAMDGDIYAKTMNDVFRVVVVVRKM